MEKNIKDEFISTLSHEVRTPLTSIKGFCKTMLSNWDKLDDDKKKEFLNIILNQSQRLINLTENVLNVAKIDSGTGQFVPVKTDINSAVQNCVNMVKMNYHKFDFRFEKSKNSLYSLCDSDKIQQVLLNVLDNAAKYSRRSDKIDIKTYNSGDFNIIGIKNYGSFIEEKKFDKIFEKFYRADSYINSTAQGSGLGLYIVKSLVEKMRGKIEVKSSENENYTEFLIYLPVYEIESVTKNLRV